MEYLTVEDVANRLHVHPETVRRMLRDGRLHGRLLSRQLGWRIPESEVGRLMAEPADATAEKGAAA